MTSVAVISSAAARIECLKKLQNQSERLPKEIDDLLKGLKGIKELLVAAHDKKIEAAGDEFVKLEKQVVQLSYEIVDAIADGPFKPKEKFSVSMLTQRRKSGIGKLAEVDQELKHLLDALKKKINPASTASSELQEEKTASPEVEQKPEKKYNARRPLERKKSETSLMAGLRKISPFQSKPKEKTPASTAGSETEAGPEQRTGSEIQAGPEQKPESTEIQDEDVDLLHRIRQDLLSPSPESSEVYMVGESGMGKSTLAQRLIQDEEIKKKFNVISWVPINHNFQIKGVLQVLLHKLGNRQQQQREIKEMNEIQLIAQIFDQLKNKSYLIVLDDVATMDDWESIRLALPVTNSNRVIITTSSNDFDQQPHCYKISGLRQPQILSLLKIQAGFEPGSEKIGKAIFDISGGSPLFATILGKSLQSEVATGGSEQELVDELDAYEPQKGTPHVLGACYKRLAHELRPCLLYMGQFPQGQDIEFDKMYLLLLAENLLSPKEDSKITPQAFKEYLDKLARLMFVGVQEDIVSTNGLYKSCRLHDQVREFCKSKGLDEEFFEVVELESSKKVGAHTRRLSIHLSKLKADNFIKFDSRDTAKKILSLLIFDTFDESADEEKSEIHDLTEFSHLRILNFDGINFKAGRFPKGVDKLVLLRYLSFRGCWLEELPSSMSHLTQLETLDLLVQAECNVLIPNSILTNMKRMVHLYLPRLYHSKGKSKLRLQAMEMLEILVNFNMEIFDVEDLSHLKKLKIFSAICIGHSKHLDVVISFLNEGLKHSSVDIKRFDCYNSASVSALKKLLQCQFVHSIQIDGQIVELPKGDGCAERVVEVVLDGSQLEHDPMSYLGRFQNLRSLVLSNDAFLGGQIVISAAPLFRNLRSLKLQNLQYLEKIAIDKGAMPELSALQIEGCDCLLELSIPKQLLDGLKKKNGGGAQSVMALPSKVNIITP